MRRRLFLTLLAQVIVAVVMAQQQRMSVHLKDGTQMHVELAQVDSITFGTATTIDAVDENGVYLGGTIGPGLQVSLDALVSRTAMLPRVELQMPPTILGRNTVEQIQAGVVAGYVGNMNHLIRQTKAEMGIPSIPVIATGGLSRLIAGQTDQIDIVDATLTLDGLQMIYDRNRDAKPVEIRND